MQSIKFYFKTLSQQDPTVVFKVSLVIIILGYILTLWNRYIYIDDAWFGEQAWWFAKNGIPRAETFKGYFGWDSHLLVYHRFSIIFGAFLIKLFGWSVENFRLATLVILMTFFVLLYKYRANADRKYSQNAYLFWLAFIFANPLLISLSFTYRPEILVMFFGFLSWWSVEKSLEHDSRSFIPVLGGTLAGIAFFTHLNGLIFPIAGFIILLINKRIKPLIFFSIAAFLTSSLFFYDLWQAGRFEIFLYQLRNWSDPVGGSYLKSSFFDWLKHALIKLFNEHQRFFWSYKVWMVSAMFVFSLIFFFKTLMKQNRNLLIYLFVLIFSLNVFGSQIAERYLIYFLPFMAIVTGMAFKASVDKGKRILSGFFKFMAALQFVFCLIMIVTILRRNENFVSIHSAVLNQIPDKQELVLVDYPFVFNGIETHKLITFKLFEYFEVKEKKKFNALTFAQRANDLGIKYIIFPTKPAFVENANYTELFNNMDSIPFYEKFLEAEGYLILRHIPESRKIIRN